MTTWSLFPCTSILAFPLLSKNCEDQISLSIYHYLKSFRHVRKTLFFISPFPCDPLGNFPTIHKNKDFICTTMQHIFLMNSVGYSPQFWSIQIEMSDFRSISFSSWIEGMEKQVTFENYVLKKSLACNWMLKYEGQWCNYTLLKYYE